MTLTLKGNGSIQKGTEASQDLTNISNGTAKCWVNFNGMGTVAVRDGFNVSSLTDQGVGTYDVNMTVPMSNTNYTCLGALSGGAGPSMLNQSVSSYRMWAYNSSWAAADPTSVNSAVYGAQ